MTGWALALLTVSLGVAAPAVAQDREAVARELLHCAAISEVFSRSSARRMGEQRDYFIGSAAALTSRQFVAAEFNTAVAKVEAKIDQTRRTSGDGGSQQQRDVFVEDLKACRRQVGEHRDEISEGLKKSKGEPR